MNLTRVFSGNYDDLNEDDIIFGINSDIYKKNKSLDINEWLILSYKDNNLKWEYLCSIHDNTFLPYGSLIENINRLSYTTEESILENGVKYSYLMIYKVNDQGTLTHTMILSTMNSQDTYGWKELKSDLNIHLINKYITSKSMKDIPIHIDLTKDKEEKSILPFDPYSILDDNEPLSGWSNEFNDNFNDNFISKINDTKDIKIESNDLQLDDVLSLDSDILLDNIEVLG